MLPRRSCAAGHRARLFVRLSCLAVLAVLQAPAPAASSPQRLVVSGNGGVSDDPAFPLSWDQFSNTVNSSRVDANSPDALVTDPQGYAYHYGLFPVVRAGLLHFDVSGVPAGRRVKQATLHLKTYWAGLNPDPARPDSVFACADTSASDARWVGANLASYSEPREGESGPWSPELSARVNYRQFGIVSRPWSTPVPASNGAVGVGWWSLDVTRGVQAWANGRPNAGFWLFGRAWYNKTTTIYWSQAATAVFRPWLEVVWEDEAYSGPWPGGAEVAFTFSTDDGFRGDNLAWVSAMDSLGYRFTICVTDSFIEASPLDGPGAKLLDGDLAPLAQRGYDIAGHSTAHREWNPETVPDSVVVWGVERDSISEHVGPDYVVKSMAWPFHLHNRRMMEIAREEGYAVARNGGVTWTLIGNGQLCSWDSCRIYEVGVTCLDAYLVPDESATREYIRRSITEGIEHGNCWLNLYSHTVDGRYSDGNGVSRQELIWTIDELKRSGVVWIETLANVAKYYGKYHVPAAWDPLLLVLNDDGAPRAKPDSATTPEDTAVVVDVLANDFAVEGTLDPASVAIVTAPTHGEAQPDPLTGCIRYAPAPDYFGDDAFAYVVADEQGIFSNAGQVSVAVSPVNDPPRAVPDHAVTFGLPWVEIDILANDADVDGIVDPSSVAIAIPPLHGTAIVAPLAGSVTYESGPTFSEADTFYYTVCDDLGLASPPTMVAVAVDSAGLTAVSPPARLGLAQNYPNPFNPLTRILFELRAAGPVRLTVYGLNGAHIATLIDAELAAGPHEAVWNGRDDHGCLMASGPYFYRLAAGSFRQTRRMMLVK